MSQRGDEDLGTQELLLQTVYNNNNNHHCMVKRKLEKIPSRSILFLERFFLLLF